MHFRPAAGRGRVHPCRASSRCGRMSRTGAGRLNLRVNVVYARVGATASIAAGAGAGEQKRPLAGVAGNGGRTFELAPCIGQSTGAEE